MTSYRDIVGHPRRSSSIATSLVVKTLAKRGKAHHDHHLWRLALGTETATFFFLFWQCCIFCAKLQPL